LTSNDDKYSDNEFKQTVSIGTSVKIGSDEELAEEFPNEIPDTSPPSPRWKMSKKCIHFW
jgi:hypothetical protein